MPDIVDCLPNFDVLNLMTDLEEIASDTHVSGDDYVYVKRGKAKTEGRMGHWFTSALRKTRTAKMLQDAIREKYGASVGDPLANLIQDRVGNGQHQLKVKDLRRFVNKAKAIQLEELAREAQEDNAADRDVTRTELHNLFVQKFGRSLGHRAYVLTMEGKETGRLSNISQHLKDGEAAVERLKKLPESEAQALVNFLGREATKERFVKLLRERYDYDDLPLARTLIGPKICSFKNTDFISEALATDILGTAKRLHNQRDIGLFMDKVVKDPLASRLAGLEEKHKQAAEFGKNVQAEVKRRLPEAKKQANQLREVAAKVQEFAKRSNKNPVSKLYLEYEEATLKKWADKQHVTPADLMELERDLMTQYKRETDLKFAIQYEIDRHPRWTKEQTLLYREVMTYAGSMMPMGELFLKGGNVSSEIATALNGEFIFDLQKVEDKASFFKALALAGQTQASWILEHMEAVSTAFRQGPVSIGTLCTVLYGKEANRPLENRGIKDIRDHFLDCQARVCREMFDKVPLADAKKKSVQTAFRAKRPRERAKDEKLVAEEADRWLEGMLFTNFMTALQSGLKFESALACLKDPERSLTLDDFVATPAMGYAGMTTEDAAVKQWLLDFNRQADGQTIIIHESNNRVTQANGGQDGVLDDELTEFKEGKKVSKHRQVLEALKRLCGGNEAQYLLSIAALTQAGVPYLKGLVARLFDPGMLLRNELTDMTFDFSKREDGCIVIDCVAPQSSVDPEGAASTSAKLVIRPDGTAVYESFTMSLEKLPAPAGGQPS